MLGWLGRGPEPIYSKLQPHHISQVFILSFPHCASARSLNANSRSESSHASLEHTLLPACPLATEAVHGDMGGRMVGRVNQYLCPRKRCLKSPNCGLFLWHLSIVVTIYYNVTKSKGHSQEEHCLFLKTLDLKSAFTYHCYLVPALSSTVSY